MNGLTSTSLPRPRTVLRLPEAPSIAVGHAQAAIASPDGEVRLVDLAKAAAALRERPAMLVHAPVTLRRLGLENLPALDLLELFAFVRPARFCLPTPRGLARSLGLPVPADLESEAGMLPEIAGALLAELGDETDLKPHQLRRRRAIASAMAAGGWRWGPAVMEALDGVLRPEELDRVHPTSARAQSALSVWEDLPDWAEHAPEPPPGHIGVDPAEARQRLAQLLGEGAEARPQQADYASAAAAAFAPREREGEPNFVLAEAGTGVGKTLGYIAPASLWAEKNDGTVWISTFTRNLQHQIDGELDRLYPDPAIKTLKAVVRKGRENYLCLLNLEEAVRGLPSRPQDIVALGLMARFGETTRDGDLVGGDFPGWLSDLVGRNRSLGLADRRGECVYSACPHYHRCYIERSIRRARRADIVIANHALVMIQAAIGPEERSLPSRYVFDEGHHLFDAADGTFASHLSGMETGELRRWILGTEGGRGRSRARGLKRRIEDLLAGDEPATQALEEALVAAAALPGEGWHQRLAEKPKGPTEAFLAKVRQQVYARDPDATNPYSLETDVLPMVEGLAEAGAALTRALGHLELPLKTLMARLSARLDEEAEGLDTATRLRIEAMIRALKRRGTMETAGWRAMLEGLGSPCPPQYVEWFGVERVDGRDLDIGMYRHWLDPMLPFAETVASPAQGILVTSATLTDGSGDVEADWRAAEARSGASHLPMPAIRARVPSPFDYANQTRLFVVTDVRKDDLAIVASAYRELILAAGGGALGLFTAIQRLREVYRRLAPALEREGLQLLAQHVDPLDTATLVDIFRAEENASLLGTDAVRDGVDVPGRSLRLVVFDRVPWARPNILHRARRKAMGGKDYDDRLVRLRLKQAFGRLIRRADDHGVFVLLDPMMPSRLKGAFPEGVEFKRVGLAEAVAETRAFLNRPL
ncbi:DNA helicase [Hypericibacter terrae]|uniref:DNA helicase n=1 Tax=Hypericibacter terrae TaxID=2602015 RepID=A0A5J6MPC9_9PROT|nr:ATP-dependent DNA helicase [Hypericibacter terrae]QEX19223.1 DNA helicase [Hypericibacter terrae]